MGKERQIAGVFVEELRQIADERGRVMHMIRNDHPLFDKFGEIYFSEISPGVIKAWKRHTRMTQLFAVPVGEIRLVIYDDRKNSKSKGRLEILEIGRENYQLVKIPPKLWYGFKSISEQPALLANCADLPHDVNEAENLDPYNATVPYRW